jgi:hypothetical protein
MLKVKFEDGLEGTVRFKPSHLTGVFEVLKDEDYFFFLKSISQALFIST